MVQWEWLQCLDDGRGPERHDQFNSLHEKLIGAFQNLRNGRPYKLHLTSMDYNHGFSLQPTNINIQVVPGYEHVIKVTPNESGTFSIVCNEYCGIGHHEMVGRMYVK